MSFDHPQTRAADVSADLHSHSTISDGTLLPEDVVNLAHHAGVTLYALTDHDEVRGIAAARKRAQELNLAFIAGVEISVTWAQRPIHIVGLNIDEQHPTLLSGLAQTRSGRDERAQQISQDLAKVGIHQAYEGALRFVNNPDLVSRSHFARFLVEAGHAKHIQHAFDLFLTKGKPGYVPHEWAKLNDAIDWIRAAGGVAVLAHPGRYPLSELEHRCLLEAFIDAGGQGIEVYTGSHSAADCERYRLIAKQYQLLASCGSDFHDPKESHTSFGQLPAMPKDLTPIWTAFTAH
jgi:3',5'-nucleoside bisphosphate phosphatase